MAETPKVVSRDYEGMFLFGAAATANAEEAINTVRGFIEKHGGTIQVLKKWDDRKLAYEIEKQTRGLYVLSFFNAPTSAIANIDREVRLSDTVLRCLITDASHLTAEEIEAAEPQRAEPRGGTEDEERRPMRRRDEEDEGDEDMD